MIITSLQGKDVRAYHACCVEQLESVVLVQTEANNLLIEIYGSVCYRYTEMYSAATNCRQVHVFVLLHATKSDEGGGVCITH
jgi:hypothetical protein